MLLSFKKMNRCRHLSRQEVKQTMDVDTSGCHCLRSPLSLLKSAFKLAYADCYADIIHTVFTVGVDITQLSVFHTTILLTHCPRLYF